MFYAFCEVNLEMIEVNVNCSSEINLPLYCDVVQQDIKRENMQVGTWLYPPGIDWNNEFTETML